MRKAFIEEFDADVLVIGGGPAGAWTAMRLAERGLAVTVWDRATFPRDKACGEYLSPGAVRILAARHALDDLPGAPIAGVTVFPYDGIPFSGAFASGDGMGLSIRRTLLDPRLLGMARAEGATTREGCAYRSHAWDGSALAVHGSGPDGPVRARCRALVGADGGHSAVARAMGVVRPNPRHQKAGFVRHAHGVTGMADRIELHAGLGGTVGLGPGAGGATNVTVVVRPSDARRTGDDLPAFLERFPGLTGRFAAAEWEPGRLSTGTYGHWVTLPTGNGVLLVGDSAGFVDPFTGEGMYFALRGAELAAEALCAALATGPATAAALAPYAQAHRAAFSKRYALCDVIQRVVCSPGAFSLVAGRLRRRPELADDLVRTTGDVLPPNRILSPAFAWRLLT